jgi:hypothetical protein
MSWIAGTAVSMLLLLQGATGQVAGAVGLDERTRVEAQALNVKIETVQRRAKLPAARRTPARPLAVTQSEINAWLRASAENRPRGVSEMTVRFEPQRLIARGMVDLAELKPKVALAPWNPLYWINGIVPVDLVGRVESADGRLLVTWEDIRVAAVPVSPSMLREMVVTATRGSRHYPEGLDITAPYEMPYDVRRIRLEDARALVDF